MKPSSLSYSRPQSIAKAVEALNTDDGDAKIIAGGQSLMPMLNLRMVAADRLIDVTSIETLREARDEGPTIRLGACITHDEIARGVVPDPSNGLMRYVGERIAYQAIRNRGTLGGSLALADPAADWVTTMALLGATITCHGADRVHDIDAETFVCGPYTTQLEPGDLLTGVTIPKVGPGASWGTYKLCRKTGEFAHAMATVLRAPKRSRAFLGATDGAPIKLSHVADLLNTARRWEDALGQSVSAALDADLAIVDHMLDEVRLWQSRTCLVRAVRMSFGIAPMNLECV